MNIDSLAGAIVGVTFVYAGVSKLLAGRDWPRAAERLGVPGVVAYVVMAAEIVVGLGIVLGDSWRTGFLVSGAALLVVFTLLLLRHLRSDNRPPCACFGGNSQRPIGKRDVARNISLLALVFVAILS